MLSFGKAGFRKLAGPAAAVLFFALNALGQTQSQTGDVKPIPILQGSAGFITNFDGGDAHLAPIATPVVLVPVGERWLFEARANFETDMVQLPGRSGFQDRKSVV